MKTMSTPKPIPSVSLSALLDELNIAGAVLHGAANTTVSGVFQDSRRVTPGSLFVARGGGKSSGADFVSRAVMSGAKAVLIERGLATTEQYTAWGVPVIELADVRYHLSEVAQTIYGHPSTALPVVGITGTNGKTTTALLVECALNAGGLRPARLGTIGFSFNGNVEDSALTTPEADDLTRLLAQVRDASGTHIVMEVSSHAISQRRVAGMHFDVAAFTNLTQDHLDFHGSMQEYAAAKRELFTTYAPRVSVINTLDETGLAFADHAKSKRVLRVGKAADCAIRTLEVVGDAQGWRGRLWVEGKPLSFATRLVGEHNLENLMLATGILAALEVDLDACVAGWRDVAVPGRLERCDMKDDDIVVVVDYAHTPDALERALLAVRPLTAGRVHCVFGCGGDRDPLKRPKMGAIVGRRADRITVTNDNPRTERPEVIATAIEDGLRSVGARYAVELDRAKAIEVAILQANPGDVVLLAGKGHEPYQIIGTEKRPFDDRDEARRALARRRAGASA
jgi:UDP-N-acetylmuramoyl-L-alanyl-D-glutamate--2,6-diaminopimelate ligase